jgi:PH (Pleckstrin Homology) domain-containing protein
VVNREVRGPALDTDQPLSWRVPPYQPALLMLVVCAVAALNIYGHPSETTRPVTLVLGAAALVMAVLALRMYLEVDDEGVQVRYLVRPAWLPWSEIARIEVVPEVRGSPTVRLVRHDGIYVDVPPSLLQPSKPTSKPRALAQLNSVANQLEARRARRVGRDQD